MEYHAMSKNSHHLSAGPLSCTFCPSTSTITECLSVSFTLKGQGHAVLSLLLRLTCMHVV